MYVFMYVNVYTMQQKLTQGTSLKLPVYQLLKLLVDEASSY
jgi:hypothetical protein